MHAQLEEKEGALQRTRRERNALLAALRETDKIARRGSPAEAFGRFSEHSTGAPNPSHEPKHGPPPPTASGARVPQHAQHAERVRNIEASGRFTDPGAVAYRNGANGRNLADTEASGRITDPGASGTFQDEPHQVGPPRPHPRTHLPTTNTSWEANTNTSTFDHNAVVKAPPKQQRKYDNSDSLHSDGMLSHERGGVWARNSTLSSVLARSPPSPSSNDPSNDANRRPESGAFAVNALSPEGLELPIHREHRIKEDRSSSLIGTGGHSRSQLDHWKSTPLQMLLFACCRQ